MLNHIIAFCLRNRLIVLAATLVLVPLRRSRSSPVADRRVSQLEPADGHDHDRSPRPRPGGSGGIGHVSRSSRR